MLRFCPYKAGVGGSSPSTPTRDSPFGYRGFGLWPFESEVPRTPPRPQHDHIRSVNSVSKGVKYGRTARYVSSLVT